MSLSVLFFFFSSRRRHTRLQGDWSSDVCSSDLVDLAFLGSVVVIWAMTAYQLVLTVAGYFYAERSRRDGEALLPAGIEWRSEERRVGKEGRSRWSPYH